MPSVGRNPEFFKYFSSPKLGLVVAIFALLPGCSKKKPDIVQTQHVEAELISENKTIKPGEPFWVGLRLKLEENWHLNWVNPGDAGLAPTISWELPEGFSAGEIEWPDPIKIPIDPFMLFGYEGQVLLPVQITPPSTMKSGKTVKLVAHADWVSCSEACVPGSAVLNLELKVKDETPEKNETWAGLFESTRKKLPQVSEEWTFNGEISPHRLYISLSPMNDAAPEYDRMFFYPEQQGVIDNAAKQKLTKEGNSYKLEIERDRMSTKSPDHINGVLVVEENDPQGRKKSGIKLNIPLKQIEA